MGVGPSQHIDITLKKGKRIVKNEDLTLGSFLNEASFGEFNPITHENL